MVVSFIKSQFLCAQCMSQRLVSVMRRQICAGKAIRETTETDKYMD